MKKRRFSNTSISVSLFALFVIGTLTAVGIWGTDSFGMGSAPEVQDDQDDSSGVPSIILVSAEEGGSGSRTSVIKQLPLEGYQDSLGTALSSVQDSILPALTLSTPATSVQPSWSMRTVGVGVGLSAQVGLGPIWNMTVTPHVRLIFTNSSNPVYPD